MNRFHCPVCEEKINFKRKFKAICGRGVLECPSCKSQLALKKYGSGRITANLVLMASILIFGEKGKNWLICIVLGFVFIFGQELLFPLIPYVPKLNGRYKTAIIVIAWVIVVFYIVSGFYSI